MPQCLKLLKAVKVRKLKCNTLNLLYQIMSIACNVHQLCWAWAWIAIRNRSG